MSAKAEETRDGVPLTNLDQPLFDGAEATKRDLVDYLDGVRDRIIPVLADRPLSVIRVHRGQEAFMQKNVPKYTPSWVRTEQVWAEASKREVSYALCNDRRTLLWFANQRAVEYHPAFARIDHPDRMTHLVLDLDPPDGEAFSAGSAGRASRARRARPTSGSGCGQDEWCEGRARLRADRRPRDDRGRRGGDSARSRRGSNASIRRSQRPPS